jgi:cation diffusion facilitator CzcD-associated flavoprotein CzcO
LQDSYREVLLYSEVVRESLYTLRFLYWCRRIFGHIPWANRLYFWWLALILDLAFIAFRNNSVGRLVRSKLEAFFSDYTRRTALFEYHSILIPSYWFGAKRPILDHGYLVSLHNPKVNLVKCKSLKIVGQNQLADGNGTVYAADLIILANGLKSQQLLTPMTITGSNGVDLRELWENGEGGTSAYMGYVPRKLHDNPRWNSSEPKS